MAAGINYKNITFKINKGDRYLYKRYVLIGYDSLYKQGFPHGYEPPQSRYYDALPDFGFFEYENKNRTALAKSPPSAAAPAAAAFSSEGRKL